MLEALCTTLPFLVLISPPITVAMGSAGQPPFTIGIIGGGLAGLTLSIALTHHGIPHKIYEAAKAFSEIGAGICMGPNSVLALSLIDPRLRECFMRCATYNEHQKELYFTVRYGMPSEQAGEGAGAFKYVWSTHLPVWLRADVLS